MTEVLLYHTRVESAGCFRCCLASVASEFEGVVDDNGSENPVVKIGQESNCKYCGETFVLTEGKPYAKWKVKRFS